jgi:stress response protein YsnF
LTDNIRDKGNSMTESVIGLLANREAAQRVRSALIEAGCDEGSVVIFGREAGDELAQELEERGLKRERARQYAEAVMRGGILVAAEAEKADRALAVMNRFELKAPEEMLRGEHVERAQTIEEELHVGKQQATGGKRLVTSVSEREVEKPVTLHEEEVEVERRREDHALRPEEANRAFREETVELTATSERPVVSKEARVTGEVALRKRSVERREVVRETVRRQDVDVETIPERPKTSKAS